VSDVKVTREWRIDCDGMTRVEVDADGNGNVRLFQDGDGEGDTILIDPAAVPALIEALQAAAKEAGDE
jgi:glyoxylase-like metal-dependent hydrolase (beta-lactamase superfamily II)